MALYLDNMVSAGYGAEREHMKVRRRFPLTSGTFGPAAYTVVEAILLARQSSGLPRIEREFCLRVLTSPDEP